MYFLPCLLTVSDRFETSLDFLELHFDDFPVATEEDFSSLCSVGGNAKFTVVISDDTSSDSSSSDESETPRNNNARDSDSDNPNLQETAPEMSMDPLEVYISYKFARTF
ncbi:Uncharacterized protein APZ42_033045 [Daphnia magna]|uniref:Uncharacterized protein n=1 Tax=Daphnia magna TaxID=35525 RepID=A0A0P4XF18_9CRUS|nr:Uncharacterized protein APZ42_033045 [Daphnia magna]